jgi:hypothetical protein
VRKKKASSVPGHRRLRKRRTSDAKTIKTNTTPSECVFSTALLYTLLESAYFYLIIGVPSKSVEII